VDPAVAALAVRVVAEEDAAEAAVAEAEVVDEAADVATRTRGADPTTDSSQTSATGAERNPHTRDRFP
jgi:hypothetical protein